MSNKSKIISRNTSSIEIKPISNFRRYFLIIVGTVFVVIAILGIFLPLLPTTPFLLLAASCYAKSSQRFYNWLLNNRLFGNYIKNYRDGKGIPLKIKVFSTTILWLTISYTAIFIIEALILRVILFAIALGVTIHLIAVTTLKK